MDRYILHELHALAVGVKAHYNQCAVSKVYRAITLFSTVDLSTFYFEAVKTRLYADGPKWRSRRSAQTALHHILCTVTRLIAPIACHTAEEMHHFYAGVDPAETAAADSVLRSTWCDPPDVWVDSHLSAAWAIARSCRQAVNRAVQRCRTDGVVSGRADACVTLRPTARHSGRGEATLKTLAGIGERALAEAFVVSDVALVAGGAPTRGARIVIEDKCQVCTPRAE